MKMENKYDINVYKTETGKKNKSDFFFFLVQQFSVHKICSESLRALAM